MKISRRTFLHSAGAAAIAFGIDGHKALAAPENFKLKIVETTDVHGSLFPYDFIDDMPVNHSLAQVYSYVKKLRDNGDNVLLVDNGDILQGQPIVNFYNFEKNPAKDAHIVADVMNYMEYDSVTVGNHDVEPGPEVYMPLQKQFRAPWLAANVVDRKTGKPFFTPYKIVERGGLKVAILGMVTPGIPDWLPERVWRGMEFQDMIECAKVWVPRIRKEHDPDLLIGVFHSGADYTYAGRDENTPKNENAAKLVPMKVKGFDVVFDGHDHKDDYEWVNGTLFLGCKNACKSLAVVEISMTRNGNGWTKTIEGEVFDATTLKADKAYMATFAGAIEETKQYAGEQLGTIDTTISSRDAMFGDSAFNDVIHELQFMVAEKELKTPCAISFAAPLQFDKTIEKGALRVRDMYKLYKYENQLFVMELTGAEIKGALEYSYDKWFRQMQSDKDHLIHFTRLDEATGNYDLAARYYNYDSAAGLKYDVDVSKPAGERVIIHSMVDGSDFDLGKTYSCAVNSYRGGGGGAHLTTGAGIAKTDLHKRRIAFTERDLRHYLMAEIRKTGELRPRKLNNWKVVPVQWAAAATKRDLPILYKEGADGR